VTTLYGIKKCDTVKKARKWLKTNNIRHDFHDLRIDGLTSDKLHNWADLVSWEDLLNKRSTTWKQLSDDIRSNIDRSTALEAMLANPTLIKRPVLENDGSVHIGYKAEQYQALFGNQKLGT